MSEEKFNEWAILEIMGHQTYAGRVSEQAVGGASFVRIDIPEIEGQAGFTKIFGAGSIYCISPCTEQVARAMAARYRQVPINRYDLPDEWKSAIDQHAKRLPVHSSVNSDRDDDEMDVAF